MYEVYHHNQLSSGNLARSIHKAFNFSADNTYRGKPHIEIRRSDDLFSVSARTDDQIREFIMEFGGKTQFIETWPHYNPYQIGSKVTSFVFPELGVAQRQEAAEMAFIRKDEELEWMDGAEAEKIRRIHRYMVEEVIPLVRDYLVDPEIMPADASSQIHKYRSEEKTNGTDWQAFMAGLNGPAGPF